MVRKSATNFLNKYWPCEHGLKGSNLNIRILQNELWNFLFSMPYFEVIPIPIQKWKSWHVFLFTSMVIHGIGPIFLRNLDLFLAFIMIFGNCLL